LLKIDAVVMVMVNEYASHVLIETQINYNGKYTKICSFLKQY